MELIKQKVDFYDWIKQNTTSSISVVEMGAGFFQNLRYVDSYITKIGIEIWKPYIDNAVFNDCIKIHGNILEYRNLVRDFVLDTVMIIDVLEHFDQETGYKWIDDLKKDFNKILLMLPSGKHEQNSDTTGFGAHEYQTHRSYWYDKDVEKLNFTENIIDDTFHKKQGETGCYFCVWKKK